MSAIGRFKLLAITALGLLLAGTAHAQGGGRTNLIRLTVSEAVQKELGLNAEVTEKLKSLYGEFRSAQHKANDELLARNLQNQSVEEEQQKINSKYRELAEKLESEINCKIKAVVTSDQYQRLLEIQFQYNLLHQGYKAITTGDVAEILKLTDGQLKQLANLDAEFARKRALRQEEYAKLRDQRAAKTVEVLTAEQLKKLDTLKGKDFDLSRIRLGGQRPRPGAEN